MDPESREAILRLLESDRSGGDSTPSTVLSSYKTAEAMKSTSRRQSAGGWCDEDQTMKSGWSNEDQSLFATGLVRYYLYRVVGDINVFAV